MKYFNILILSLICSLGFSQSGDWIPMCDTLTGETIYVDQVNDFADCCYEWNGSDWVKRVEVDGSNCYDGMSL